jgi:hypothetical protein
MLWYCFRLNCGCAAVAVTGNADSMPFERPVSE